MTTFAALGIPFPLFEAPIESASEYVGVATCRICNGQARPCFRLGIGCAVFRSCPACGAENGLDSYDRAPAPCRRCGSQVPFPDLPSGEIYVCYECLRSGRAGMTKGTEFGMVSWEQAFAGITHGGPDLQSDQFELVPIDSEDGWYGVRLPSEQMWELLRTPGYVSWQGDRWLFCCRAPMTYVGEWDHVLACPSLRGTEPERFLQRVLDSGEEAGDHFLESVIRHSGACVYVFECKACGRLRANADCD